MTPVERLIAGLTMIKSQVKSMNTYNGSHALRLLCSQLSNEHEKQLQVLGFEIAFTSLPPDECYVIFAEDDRL